MSGLPTSVGSEVPGYELQDISVVIISVVPESPAFNAGLEVGDKIVSLKNENNTTSEISLETIKSFVVDSGNEELEIGYIRGNTDPKTISVKPIYPEGATEPIIGIGMDKVGIAKLPILKALKEGMFLTLSITKSTAVGLYRLILDSIQGQGSIQSITGPVGLVGIVGDAYQFGLVYLLSFTALISINLAIINLIPFPALDGGRLLFLLIEKIKGSRINQNFFNLANLIGFFILILLMIIVTYHDLVKLIM